MAGRPCWWARPGARTASSTTPLCCWPTARCWPSATRCDLPNYGVFDEKRVFAPGPPQGPMNFRGVRLGVMVCEDMWTPEVTECLGETGAEILLVPNGSPYEHAKHDERIELAAARTWNRACRSSMSTRSAGRTSWSSTAPPSSSMPMRRLKAQLPAWQEVVALTRWRRSNRGWHCAGRDRRAPLRPRRNLSGHDAGPARLCGQEPLSRRGAGPLRRHRFRHLRRRRRRCAGAGAGARVMLPSPYTSRDSLEDAAACARLLGIRIDTISIEPAMQAFAEHAGADFAGRAPRHDRGEHPEPRPRRDADGASPTSSGTWCSPPATSPRCRSAMPRSMATCAAAIPC